MDVGLDRLVVPVRCLAVADQLVGVVGRVGRAAASTSSVTWAWVLALPLTEPTERPSGLSTKAITVTWMPCITPLVVSVLLAQRRLALVALRTITTVSSAVEVARACSTSDWGVAVVLTVLLAELLTGRPPGSC